MKKFIVYIFILTVINIEAIGSKLQVTFDNGKICTVLVKDKVWLEPTSQEKLIEYILDNCK